MSGQAISVERHCEWCGGEVAVDAGPCPLSLQCPTCKAQPGQWCRRPSEHRAAQLHRARVDLEHAEKDRHARSEADAAPTLLTKSNPLPTLFQLADSEPGG